MNKILFGMFQNVKIPQDMDYGNHANPNIL